MNRFPLNSFSSRKPYTPNHPHSLDSHNGSSRCARLIQHPRKSRLRFLEKHGWPMVEIGNSAMRHVCERAQVICAPITMRSVIPRPHLAARVGTARDFWHPTRPRHPFLALPGFRGAGRVSATQLWHCQDFWAKATQGWQCQDSLARGGLSPLSVGTARIFWRRAGPHFSSTYQFLIDM